jgi:tape measure domain-containing protein
MALNAGAAFNSNDEIVAFMEQVNKQFVIGGASATEASAAMLQLTQSMAAGVLRGDELNSVLEQAPEIARAIETYMGWAEGSIKSYAEQGLVTADVVKNALFSVADETNAKFESMPMTWSQVWTVFQNKALSALDPVLSAINWVANNINIIAPLVLSAGAAFVVFQIAANWTKIAAVVTGIYNAAVTLLSIGFGVLTGNTAAASAAVMVFNSALLASPITWIIMIIAIAIGLLYAVVAVINKVTGKSLSATGIIMGVLNTIKQGIFNVGIMFSNVLNNIGVWVANTVSNAKSYFYSLLSTVISVIAGIASLLNKLPFVDFDYSGLTSAAADYAQKAADAANKPFEYTSVLSGTTNLKDAYNAGYQWVRIPCPLPVSKVAYPAKTRRLYLFFVSMTDMIKFANAIITIRISYVLISTAPFPQDSEQGP